MANTDKKADKKAAAAARKAKIAKMSDAEKKAFLQQEKAQKFKDLASSRVSKALDALDKVAALSNRRSYIYDDAQVEKIRVALETRVGTLVTGFQSGSTGGAFTL